jgi:uncharacterized protein with gpF-like domain
MTERLTRGEIALKALHVPAALEDWYREQLQLQVHAMAGSLLAEIRACYRKADFAMGLATDAADDGPIGRVRRRLRAWGRTWTKQIKPASTRIATAFARRAQTYIDLRMQKTLRESGFTVRFTATPAMKQAYQAVIAEQVNLIQSIPQQFLKDVESKVWLSVMKGADLATLTRSLEETYEVTHRRAALIARDQNAKAKAVMEGTRRQELGITEAIWQHSGAGKEPRPEHVKWGREGKRFSLKRGMYSQADGEYVWPGTPINCRCTSRAILPGL